MYIYSTSDRFSKIRQSKSHFPAQQSVAYIPGPGGIEYDSQKKSNPFISPRFKGNHRPSNSFASGSSSNHKKNNSMVMSQKLCENCYNSHQQTNEINIQQPFSENRPNQAQSNSSSNIYFSLLNFVNSGRGKQQFVSSAMCDECYQSNLQSIEQERRKLDQEIKQVEDKLKDSVIDEQFNKTKKAPAEECNLLYSQLRFIVLINSRGYFVKYSSSDRNYDPEYTKVPEIGDPKKSFNIASNKFFQTQMLGQTLTQFNQQKRIGMRTNNSNVSNNGFISPKRKDQVSPGKILERQAEQEKQKQTQKMMQIIHEKRRRRVEEPLVIQSSDQDYIANIQVKQQFIISPSSSTQQRGENIFLKHEQNKNSSIPCYSNIAVPSAINSCYIQSAHQLNSINAQAQLQKYSKKALNNSTNVNKKETKAKKRKQRKTSNYSLGDVKTNNNFSDSQSKPLIKLNTNISNGSQGDCDDFEEEEEEDQESQVKNQIKNFKAQVDEEDDDDDSNVDDEESNEHSVQQASVQAPQIIKDSRQNPIGHSRMKSMSIKISGDSFAGPVSGKSNNNNYMLSGGTGTQESFGGNLNKHQNYFGTHGSQY